MGWHDDYTLPVVFYAEEFEFKTTPAIIVFIELD